MEAASTSAADPKPSAGWTAWLRFGVAAVLLVYLVRSAGIDWSSFGGFLDRPALLLGVAAMLGTTVYFTAVRLPVLLGAAGFSLGTREAVQLSLIGMFFGLFLPGSASGDAAKIYYTVSKQERGTRAELATIVLLDRAIAMWALFAMPFLAAPFFTSEVASSGVFQTLLVFCGVVFGAGTLVLAAVFFVPIGWIDALRNVIRWELPWRIVLAVREFRRSLGAVAVAFGLSVVAHSAAIATTAVVAAAVAPSSLKAELALVVPLGFVANAIPLTPGGLGVGELAFHRLFDSVGMTGGAEVAIGWRVGVMAAALLGGWIYVRGFRGGVRAKEASGGSE